MLVKTDYKINYQCCCLIGNVFWNPLQVKSAVSDMEYDACKYISDGFDLSLSLSQNPLDDFLCLFSLFSIFILVYVIML